MALINHKLSVLEKKLVFYQCLILLFIGINIRFSFGQGLHFAQFSQTPLHVNPALTGEFDGVYRFNSLFRNQWANVPVDYETFTGSFDMNIGPSCSSCAPYSVGALFTHDISGLTRFKLTQFGISGVIRRPLARRHHFSVGLMLGVGQRSFDLSGVSTSAVFGSSGFDPFYNDNLNNMSYTFFDVATGFNISLKGARNTRTTFNIGLGVYHLNRPNASFIEKNAIRQTIGYNTYFLGTFQASEKWDILANGVVQFHVGGQREIMPVIGGKYYFSNGGFWKDFAVEGLLGIRVEDAVIPMIGINYRSWRLGGTYEVNTSDFNIATNNNGGWEVSLRYIFKNPRFASKKFCPIHL